MSFIKLSTGQFPYTLEDLRRDHPKISFPNVPTQIELSNFDCAAVTVNPAPEYDPDTEIIELQHPELVEGEWRSNWVLRALSAEEIAAKFPPNWGAFNAAMLADEDFNTVYATVNATHPLLASSLPTALSQVASNGVEAFALVFNAFIGVSSATSEQREAWAGLATAANLPQEFVDILLP
jgi:hypothetical protein